MVSSVGVILWNIPLCISFQLYPDSTEDLLADITDPCLLAVAVRIILWHQYSRHSAIDLSGWEPCADRRSDLCSRPNQN